jgi:GH35 family endo-1,4-beta-xylanase
MYIKYFATKIRKALYRIVIVGVLLSVLGVNTGKSIITPSTTETAPVIVAGIPAPTKARTHTRTIIRTPPAPTGVSATDGTYTTKVLVRWNAAPGATSYKVYRAISATGTKSLLGTPTATSFNDTTATPGRTYYYWVKACNGANCSSNSVYNTGWLKISPPTGVSATDGTYTTKVLVRWSAAPGATSYKVYRAISATGTKSLLGTPTGTSFNDTTATPGRTYYYWVVAYRGTRYSGYSVSDIGWRKLPYASTEPYGYYDFGDSFENVSNANLEAYGITSSRNTVKVNSTNYYSGHQSIEADGIIGGNDLHYSLSFDFSVQKILGSSSYDFSNKTIVLSVFIPADSPIRQIYFEADKGNEFVQVTGAKITEDPHVSWLWTQFLPKGQWVEAVIDIRDISTHNNWAYTWGPHGPLTNEEALDVVKHCEVFKILGFSDTSGGPFSTYFLLDDLRWLDRDSINIDTNADSLRKYAANTHLYVGSFAEYGDLFSVVDAKFSQVLAQEFNLLIASPHFFEFEPSKGVIDFSKMDAMVDFAIGNHMAVFSYMGVMHTQLPAWLMNNSLSFSELGPVLTNFIDTIGQRYRGKIAIWNVFSEVVNDAGDGFRNRQTPNTPPGVYSPWVDGSDTSLIKAAFRQARISDPHAKLILNDYETEEIGRQKSEFFYNFVSELVAEGVPIDGVGFEMHAPYPPMYPNTIWETPRILDLPTYLSDVDANVKRYAALGLQVVFSEIDVPIYINDIDTNTAAGQAELRRRINYEAQIFSGLMKVALANPNVIALNTWCFTDRYSWVYNSIQNGGLPEYGYPDMFDMYYKPKPAYDEVLKALMNP